MATLEGFYDFFNALGVTARFFDLGRRIQPISSQQFRRCDQYQSPYPSPYLGHACLGIVFWEAETDEDHLQALPSKTVNPMLWSLKFPLDEQGFFCPQARQQFLQQILVSMGNNVSAAQSGKALQSVLDNNPFAMKLTDDRQAAYFAKVSLALGRAPSEQFRHVSHYLEQLPSNPKQEWASLSLQGLAELACRHADVEEHLIQALPHLPQPVFSSLCHLLEHEKISHHLCKAIIDTANQHVKTTASSELNPWQPAAIRAISFSDHSSTRQGFLQSLLSPILQEKQTADIESIIAMASRCPQDLTNPSLTSQYLEVLAHFGEETFMTVASDLLRIAEVRPHLLASFRNADRSDSLSACIGALYQSFQQHASQHQPVTH